MKTNINNQIKVEYRNTPERNYTLMDRGKNLVNSRPHNLVTMPSQIEIVKMFNLAPENIYNSYYETKDGELREMEDDMIEEMRLANPPAKPTWRKRLERFLYS